MISPSTHFLYNLLVCWSAVLAAPSVVNYREVRGKYLLSPEDGLDGCDWNGISNPDILADKSVQTEYLRCGSGKIRWHHPEGAVSIKIELPQYSLPKPSTSKKTEHRLCLSVDFATVKGVNLYLQDREAMTLLYTTGKRQVAPETGWITAAPSNSESDSIQNRCFPLSGRFAVLFLEHFFDSTNLVSISADKIPENEPIYSRLPSTGVAKIDYDIQAYN